MTKKIKKICILGGGWSNEREISLKSSNDVFYSLRENGHDVMLYDMREDSFDALSNFIKINSIDIVFNLIHGEGGEDGLIQGYLDEIGVEYCGSGSHASSISFNKNLTKQIWIQKNLYTPEFILFNNQTYDDIKI